MPESIPGLFFRGVSQDEPEAKMLGEGAQDSFRVIAFGYDFNHFLGRNLDRNLFLGFGANLRRALS